MAFANASCFQYADRHTHRDGTDLVALVTGLFNAYPMRAVHTRYYISLVSDTATTRSYKCRAEIHCILWLTADEEDLLLMLIVLN